MTDAERQEFEEMKSRLNKAEERISMLEGANDVLSKRILSTLNKARQMNLLPKL